MIRVGPPLPAFVRLHIRAQITAQRATRRSNNLRLAVRLAHTRFCERILSALLPTRRGQRAAVAEVTVNELIDRYDDLIDLLCWAANEGVKDHHRVRYTRARSWFIENYECVRPALLAYLPEERDRAAALCDPFESLFIPVTLDAVVNSSSVIAHIQTTRDAVEAYRADHQLVAA